MLETTTTVRRAVTLAVLVGFALFVYVSFGEFLPALLKGAVVTLQVFFGALILFIPVAFLAGLAKTSPLRSVRWIAAGFIDLFRGTSLLVQLFWFFFVLPEFGLTLSPMTAAIVVLGLNFGAFGAEVVRGAVGAVPDGQWDAASALGLRRSRRMILVILPQILVTTIPAMANLVIELMKSTSLVSAVTLVDITFASVQQNQFHYRTVEIFACTMIIYYVFARAIQFAIERLERRVTRYIQPVGNGT